MCSLPHQTGRALGKDIEIEITGLRPGEKLTEALLDETETALPCAPKVLEVVSSSAGRITAKQVAELQAFAEKAETESVRRLLFELVGLIRREKPGSSPNLRVVVGG